MSERRQGSRWRVSVADWLLLLLALLLAIGVITVGRRNIQRIREFNQRLDEMEQRR